MNSNDIKARLRKNSKRLAGQILDQKIEAFRLYNHDIPEFPFYVDIVGPVILIYDRRQRFDFEKHGDGQMDAIKEAALEIKSELQQKFGHKEMRLVIKERQNFNHGVNASDNENEDRDGKTHQYQKETTLNHAESFLVKEGELNYLVNVDTYLDYGLFLDHRPLRRWIQKLSGIIGNHFGKVIPPHATALNLFCYTGSVSVAMAQAGFSVTSVDLSATYLDWAKRNFECNQIRLRDTNHNHRFIQDDVLEWPEQYLRTNESTPFDLIFLDPPTFSNSKRMKGVLDIKNDHPFLIEQSLDLLKASGLLLFSTNCENFKLDKQLEEMFQVKDITEASIPTDFQPKRPHRLYAITHA